MISARPSPTPFGFAEQGPFLSRYAGEDNKCLLPHAGEEGDPLRSNGEDEGQTPKGRSL